MAPLLLLMKGHPGVGKSALARRLAQRLHCALVDKDDVRDCFQDLVEGGNGQGVDWNNLSYKVMFNIARANLANGLSVVVDCPLAHLWLYRRAEELATQAGAKVVVVECSCSDEVLWRQRLEQRGQQDAGTPQAHKPGTWAVLQATLTRYNGCWRWSLDGSVCVPHHVMVDSAGAGEEDMLRSALRQLQDMKILPGQP